MDDATTPETQADLAHAGGAQGEGGIKTSGAPANDNGGLSPEAVVDDPLAEVAPGDPEIAPGAPDASTHTSGGKRLILKRNGAETGDEFPISGVAVIGRFDPAVGPIDVDLGQLPEGAYVSRKHAKLTETDGAWTISDLGSSNGTFLLRDGEFERVETAELSDGDEFALGNARFVFRG